MKGKKIVIYKLAILLVAIVTAIVFVGLRNRENGEKIYAVTTIGNETFSAVDSNNLILSAEKVAVISTTDQYSQDVFSTPLYTDSAGVETTETMLSRGNNPYYYLDIANSGNEKYVIGNGEFVMLNNDETIVDGQTYYSNSDYSSYIQTDTGYSVQSMAEAVMLSFGQYVYDAGAIIKADEDSGANIQYINIIAYRNGSLITNLPGVRQYDNNTYQDFVYIIPQVEGNEGFYQFNITYRYNDTTYNQTFEFYILYESSYSNDISFGGTYTYSSAPTLNLYNTTFNADSGGAYRYYLGRSSTNYPTLIYDYTKYKMQYTLTANGKVTTYDYTYVTNSNLGGETANLVLTITNSTGTRYVTYSLSNYNSDSENNIAVILLTEMGNYDFSFSYLYSGYNAGSAPNMNLTISNQSLVITGFELKYSKANYEEAQMRYLTLSKNSADLVDLIVPNGYLRDSEPSISSLGVVYSLDTSSNAQVGSVLTSQDANLNQDMTASSATVGRILSNNVISDSGIYKLDVNAVSDIIAGINYEKTNQGSLWLSSNDTYTADQSFYYFSKVKFTSEILLDDSLNGYSVYSNQTSFSSTGYYLVFIKVDVNGFSSEQAVNYDYYQVFAFQYGTDTVNVNVVEYENGVDGKAIGSGGYTNKNVRVYWTDPDVFERKISANYYSVTNQFYNKDQLLNTTAYTLTNGQVLGQNIADRSGASFLIELNSEGRALSYRTFTIDRQPITGVSIYSVVTTTNASDGSAVYEFRTNVAGDYVRISNSITDSLATIFWNDKDSGANISLTYTFTPFVRDSSISPDQIFSSYSEIWHSTNYRLGTTVGSFDDIYKADSIGSEIPASSVLRNQGIYVFTLTDEAGNSCKYMFIIDYTESFFEVNGEMITQTSQLFGDDVTINVGTHKVISLFENSADTKSELYSLIKATSTDEYEALGYYIESDTNINALNNLFSILNSDNTYYLKVQNSSLTAYTNQGILDNSLSIPTISANNHSRVMTHQISASTSTIRTFYLLGINQAYVSTQDSDSFVTIEINKDNSRGSVYYSQDNFTINNLNNSNVHKLDTGSDNETNGVVYNGVEGAFATSDNYVAFVWTQGSGLYEVESVSYRQYELNLSEANFDSSKFYYYTSVNPRDVILYNSDGAQNGATYNDASDRYFALLNVTDGRTTEGLYVVTRTYRGDDSTDFGDDKRVQNYYFIVDRNEIIDVTNAINGGYITIGLLERETEYNEFSQIGTQTGRLDYLEDDIVNSVYNLYLSTDKLPATLNVPVGKYFGGTFGSTYYSGRLVFDVYFKDVQNQLSGVDRGKTIKLFSIDVEESADTSNYSNGYYIIDIDRYLSEISQNLRDRFIREDNEGNWLCLNGDYVVVIRDLVEGSSGSHQKMIGFRLQNSEPTTDVYSVPRKDNTVNNAIYEAEKIGGTYTLTTSEEFVKIDLNEYNPDGLNAEVDVNYLIVNRTLNGVTSEYINYRYSNTGGEYNLDNESDVVQNIRDEQGNLSRVITLNTYLRDQNGDIDIDSLHQTLYYDITIRYKLSSATDNEDYINCYYYYNAEGEMVEFYETHYRVIIDRIPPENNINNLLQTDTLVDYYIEESGVDMFESAVYEDNSGVYFVNQYTAYYQHRDVGEIYAFRVDNTTPFDKTDISRLYYRVLEGGLGSVSLNLPVTNYASYTSITNLSNVNTYAGLFTNNQYGQYIEILEQDSAGNTTQYVIFYSANGDYDALEMTFNVTRVMEGAIDDENVQFSLSKDSINNSLTIFDINLPGEEVFNVISDNIVDRFYRFELISMLGSTYHINTNASTEFTNNGLAQDIINMIKNAGQGNYIFRIYSRTNTYSTTLNYYDVNERIELNILNLVNIVNGRYQIDLAGANVTHNGITYYAEEIIVRHNGETYTYVCRPENGQYNYYLVTPDSYELVSNIIANLTEGTYQIEMTDAFGETSYHRFNTSGEDFYSLEFEGGNSYELSNVYYSFNRATIRYNSEVYQNANIIYSISGINNQTVASTATSVTYSGTEIINIDRENGVINIIPYLGANYLGEALSVTVQLIFNNEVEFVYNVVIDTRTGAVNLRDTNNSSQGMEVDINTDFEDTAYSTTSSGTMNLTWNKIENEYFNYVYLLHEEMLDGEYATEDLSEFSSWVINTGEDSAGSYKFEIQIYTKDGLYLGNKVYSFSVQAIVNQLYYVQTGNNEAVGQNSTFTFAELENLQEATGIAVADIAKAFGFESVDELPKTNIPLYISNEDLFVVISTDQGASQLIYSKTFGTYRFEVRRIYTSTYSLYIGILNVAKTDNVVNGISVNTSELPVNTNLSYTYVGESSDTFTLNFDQTIPTDNLLTRKNTVLLDVYYNDVFVKTVHTNNLGNSISFRIDGNGKYSFVFRDLAGNIHTFTTNTGVVQNSIDILILREVVITINSGAPIDNAYYNGDVVVNVYNPSMYNLGSISLYATRNGASYNPEKTQYNYTFTDYGTYRVTISANYTIGEEVHSLRKVIVFTIVNENESRDSIDLTSIGGYTISKVTNNLGTDITSNFLSVLNINTGTNGLLLTYDKMIENSALLGVSSGKQMFTLTYLVSDGIYPDREVTFSFTINNEIPNIECSLDPGESSTDGFTIRYNPGIIYDQVGDAMLYINNRLIATISSNSPTELMQTEITEERDGAGEYYIRLISSSGNVILSYKVEIKEPLNVWAIVIIVVVSVIVIAVVTTIIILRTRMRIR